MIDARSLTEVLEHTVDHTGLEGTSFRVVVNLDPQQEGSGSEILELVV